MIVPRRIDCRIEVELEPLMIPAAMPVVWVIVLL